MGALVSVAGRRPGESTEVTWAMSGQQNLFAKLMFTVMKMEQVIGKDFERGLARLTTAAETA